MPSTFTPNNGITLQATGENSNTWGGIVNDQSLSLIDTALDGIATLALTGLTSTLAITDGAASDGRNRILICTGALAGDHTITVTPNDAKKWYVVINSTTGGFSVLFAQGGGSGTTVTVQNGYTKIIYVDGTGTNANAGHLLSSYFFGGNVAVSGTLAITGPAYVTGASAFAADLAVHNVDVGTGGGSIASNTIVGDTALAANTTGLGNTVVGNYGFYQNTIGSYNTGVGAVVGFGNTGNYNTAMGYQALNATAASTGNTCFGHSALSICTGSQNTVVGNQAGSLITTGTGNVIIGNHLGASIATATNNIIIADGAATSRLHINGSGEASLGSTPVANLALDIPSTTKAMRPPCMTTVQRDAISSPGTGSWIYNTTTNKLNVFTGSVWEAVTSA